MESILNLMLDQGKLREKNFHFKIIYSLNYRSFRIRIYSGEKSNI